MPRRGKQQHSRRRSQPETKTTPKNFWALRLWRQWRVVRAISRVKKSFGLALSIVGVVVGAIGLFGVYYTMTARVSVAPSTQLNPRDPFSSFFIVKNEGATTLNWVVVNIAWDKVTYANEVLFTDSTSGYDHILPTLGAARSASVPCYTPLKRNVLKTAEISFNVSFRPAYLFWRWNERFRFRSVQDQSGNITWIPI